MHASLRDATGHLNVILGIVSISIHASLRDATFNDMLEEMQQAEFQSTHPCGMRLSTNLSSCFDRVGISIHASLRDATAIFNTIHHKDLRIALKNRLKQQYTKELRNNSKLQYEYFYIYFNLSGANLPGFPCSLYIRTVYSHYIMTGPSKSIDCLIP